MDNTIPQETPKKQCKDCKQFFPATTQFFYPAKVNADGLHSQCKECRSEYMRARYARQHPKPVDLTARQKVCTQCGVTKSLSDFKPIGSGFHNTCRECMKGQEIKKVRHSQPRQYILLPEGKTCIKCGERKPLNNENFLSKANCLDGFFNVCRQCMYQQDTERVHKRHQLAPPIFDEGREKICTTCRSSYPATPQYFHLNKRKHDGLEPQCKLCKKARTKEYNLNLPDDVRWNKFMYKQTNRESIREKGRTYARAHRAEGNARTRRRYEQQKQNGGKFTASDVLKQYEKQQGKCFWCQGTLEKYHVDHVIPVSRGGSDDPSNLVLACPFCNQSKGNKTIEEWLAYLEKYILPGKKEA